MRSPAERALAHVRGRFPAAAPAGVLDRAEVPLVVAELAARHRRELVDAELIGRAAREPGISQHRLQLLKYVWHVLALLGRPVDRR